MKKHKLTYLLQYHCLYSKVKKYFIAILLTTQLFSEIEIWNKSDILFESFTLIKSIPAQKVYEGDKTFIKIWNEKATIYKYHRNAFFFHAAKNDYLTEIAPLKALIIDDQGNCCGYATFACQPIHVNLSELRKRSTTHHNDETLAFLKLLSKMREMTLKNGICFNDLDPSNFGLLDGDCYFFDLDGIWEFELYKNTFPNWKEALFYLY